jgi:acetyltransferase
MAALEQLLVRFSQLVIEQRWIKEIDINPLLASAEGLVALDARVILHDPQTQENELPKSAIRPYPVQYVSAYRMPDGQCLALRPIRPDDESMMIEFHHTLSEESVHLRYFGAMSLSQRTTHERLIRICFIDYDRQIALVAVRHGPEITRPEIVAIGRLIRRHGTPDAEVAVLVSDPFQGKGVGTELVRRLLEIAPQEGIKRVVAEMLPENQAMQQVCRELGFQLRYQSGGQAVESEFTFQGRKKKVH